MQILLTIISLGLIAYLGSLLQRKRRSTSPLWHLFHTGFIYTIAGAVLGPGMSGLLTGDVLDSLEPLAHFCLGWVGFLIGMQVQVSLLRQVPKRFYGFAATQFTSAFVLILIPSLLTFRYVGVSGPELLLLSFLTATCAAVSAQTIPMMAAGKMPEQENYLLKVTVGLDDVPAMIFAVFIFAFAAPGGGVHPVERALLWVGVSLLIGASLGLILYLLLRFRTTFDETLAISLAVLFMASGAGAYLHLAPPVIGFVAGVIVVNSPLQKKEQFYGVLTKAERPIVLILFLLAGAWLRLDALWWLASGAGYVLVRAFAKVSVPSFAGKRWFPRLRTRSVGWGLISPGPLSIAIGLNYYLLHKSSAATLLLWIVVTGALLSEAMVPLALKRLLNDAEKEEN